MKKQLRTKGGKLEMVEVSKGTGRVLNVMVYRHAGDYKDGIEDSWFVLVNAELKGPKGSKVDETFTLRIMCDHGKPKDFCGNVAKNVLMAGEINLKYWKSNTPR